MQRNSGVTIAIVHGVIELGKYEQNISKVDEVAEKAKEEGAEILILPSMINGIPVFDISVGFRIKRTTETIPGRTSDHISKIAHRHGIYIVVGPILERRGSKVYRSAFVAEPSADVKHVVRQIYPPSNLGQGLATPVISVRGVSIGVFIAEDLHLPEISLMMKMVGVDLAIFYPYPYISADTVTAIMKTRALELGSIVISVGCTIKRKDEELAFIPTAIVDEKGVMVREILDKSLKVVKMFVPTDQRRELFVLTPTYSRLLKMLGKTLINKVRQHTIDRSSNNLA